MTYLPEHPHLLHPRTGDRLRAIGVTRRGFIWPQLGGSQPAGEPPAGDPSNDPPSDPGQPAAEPPKDDLGDAGKKALTEERKARKTAEAELAKYRKAEQDRADADKSEAERRAAAEQRATDADLRAMRIEVAFEKGLTPAQAKRLNGATREELEADADEVKRDFPTTPVVTPPPTLKPDPSQGPRPGGSGGSVAAGAALYAQHHQKTTVT